MTTKEKKKQKKESEDASETIKLSKTTREVVKVVEVIAALDDTSIEALEKTIKLYQVEERRKIVNMILSQIEKLASPEEKIERLSKLLASMTANEMTETTEAEAGE